MSEGMPLHVRVAEALGWTEIHPRLQTGYPPGGAVGPNDAQPWNEAPRMGAVPVPHFDTDWGAIGPEIQRFLIELVPGANDLGHWWACLPGDVPLAFCPEYDGETEFDADPRVAACKLLVRLHDEGKLFPDKAHAQ